MKRLGIADPRWKATRRGLLALTLWAWLAGAPLEAQSGSSLGSQYTTPGTPTSSGNSPTKEEFQNRLQEAPWNLGRLRLSPWLGLQDASIVTNLDGQGEREEEDFTLTVGAGLRGYLPAGDKVLWAAHVLPEYVWWQDTEAKRSFNGRYGVGLFVFFNRLNLELSQRRIEQQGFFSFEVQELTTTRSDITNFGLNVEISPNLTLFGAASRQERENQEEETETFAALDRVEELGILGLRYENRHGFVVEISHQDHANDFEEEARSLSNSGTSQVLTLGLEKPDFGFNLSVANNDFEAEPGSQFVDFTDPTGSLDVLWRSNRRLALLGYFRRNLSYSVNQRYAQILTERQGFRLNFDLTHAVLGIFAETGEDDFEITSLGAPERLDDVTAYGASLQLDLKKASLSVRALVTEYDSNLDGFDRDVTSVSIGLKLDALRQLTSEVLDRLSLSGGDTNW